MVSHMKTTIQIPDSLFEEARKVARRDHTTLKVLVEQGLRQVIAERKRRGTFKLRDTSVGGKGLQPGLRESDWDHIRALAYEGRGG